MQLPEARSISFCFVALIAVTAHSARGAEISDDLQLGVVATGVYQLGDYHDAIGNDGDPLHHEAKGSVAVDVDAQYDPTDDDTFYGLVSWARGNGLKDLGGVSLAVNADDLEDDVKNINGTSRDYLLEAWYRRRFDVAGDTKLYVTGGLLDSTRYIDHNRVANDEIEQFMNEAFVSRFFLPSYDPGLALSLKGSAWHVELVWMKAKSGPKKEGGLKYDYLAADFAVMAQLPFGEGHYHLILETSSNDFTDRDDENKSRRIDGLGISADQAIGDNLSVFARVGWLTDDAEAVVQRALYSGGAQLTGNPFGIAPVVWGIAYGYLPGAGDATGDLDGTRVFESYARLKLNRYSDFSLDVQYVGDHVRGETNPSVWVLGARLNGYY